MGKKNSSKKSKNNKKSISSTSKKGKDNKNKISKNVIISISVIAAIIILLFVAFNNDLIKIKSNNGKDNENLDSNNKVLVLVNGQEIKEDELDKSYELFFFVTGYSEEYKNIITKDSYLEQMINEYLILQKSQEEGYSVSMEDVEEEISKIIEINGITMQELKENVESYGFKIDDLKDHYKKQMMITKFLNKSVLEDVKVSDDEIKDFYEKNKDNFVAKEDQIRARHILVESEEKAQSILKRIMQGENFVELAKEESIGPSAQNGGDLGIFSKGQMVKEFEDAAFSLSVGEVSDIVETQYGFHIIKREIGIIKYDEAKENIRQALMIEKQKQELQDYVEILREESEIIYEEGDDTEKGLSGKVVADTKSGEECYSDYGLSKGTVIFYHASWCPHCSNMMPIVKELEEQGYSFHWAESDSSTGTEVVDKCFRDVIHGGVPQFICAGSKEFKLGEMSKDELKEFADKCAEV